MVSGVRKVGLRLVDDREETLPEVAEGNVLLARPRDSVRGSKIHIVRRAYLDRFFDRIVYKTACGYTLDGKHTYIEEVDPTQCAEPVCKQCRRWGKVPDSQVPEVSESSMRELVWTMADAAVNKVLNDYPDLARSYRTALLSCDTSLLGKNVRDRIITRMQAAE